jgi:hypothetical protein
VSEVSTRPPFDIAEERLIFFINDMRGVEDLKPKLKQAVTAALSEKSPDNPVYRAKQMNIMKSVSGSTDVQRFILERLDQIESKIAKPAFQPSSMRKRASNRTVEVEVQGDNESIEEFTSGLLKYGLCESLGLVKMTNGNVKVTFDFERNSEDIEGDVKAVLAKFKKVQLAAPIRRVA